ncbi:MAG: DUF882 domain-containing protein [Pedobacter sp.]
MNRRYFLKMSLAAAGTILTPWPALAKLPGATERTLSLYNTHTGEHLHQAVYWEKGSYQRETLQQINYLLRDHRTDEIKIIDPNLLDILHAMRSKIPVDAPFEIISGYRSPATNRNLQSHSSGVAKHSLHMAGQAIDIRLPGCPLAKLRKTAVSMKRGGVGYYPKSNFVHVDTGRVRYW